MLSSILERGRAWLSRVFRDRQVYVRADGRVTFVVVSARAQMIGAVLLAGTTIWVAYATVMTAFKNEVVYALQERQKTMQAAYESRLSQLRLDYDDMNEKVALAEKRMQETVAAIEERSKALQTAMAAQDGARAAMDEIEERGRTVLQFTGAAQQDGAAASDGQGGPEKRIEAPQAAPEAPAEAAPAEEKAALEPAEAPVTIDWSSIPTDRVPGRKPSKFGGDEPSLPSPVKAAESALPAVEPAAPVVVAETPAIPGIEPDAAPLPVVYKTENRNLPVAKSLAQLETRLTEVAEDQTGVAAGIAAAAEAKENAMRQILEIAGLNPDRIMAGDAPRPEGQGGPFIPLEAGKVPGADVLNVELGRAHDAYARIAVLQTAMLSIPFAAPAPQAWRLNSGFGARRDPFTGRWAYHSGLDFKGDVRQPIIATAPGTVIRAGWAGGYGRMVEIDHGMGLKTRYAHLHDWSVKDGDKVVFGQEVGKLGNSGRSTGAHLHYEVWVDNEARDPMFFMKAGENVLKVQ